jgi:hypothetical protein
MKLNLEEAACVPVVDFAESYTFLFKMAQGVHWHNIQDTFCPFCPFLAYFP